ncbi:MAG: hypothetical protein GQ582_08355 [Methyloprofundus sp.]|nr:hypothetical protein [Methyloprofundus sp.]
MKKSTKKILSVIALSKLASTSPIASAGGLGKLDSEPMSLDQVGYPLEILTPPIDAEQALTSTANSASKLPSSETGTIFAGDLGKAIDSGKQPRIDFIINNIHSESDAPVVVFLAYSTKKGSLDEWPDIPGILLDRDSVQVLSAFSVSPAQGIGPFNQQATPLGNIDNQENRSVIISLDLNDLSDISFDDDQIYFQAVSIPYLNGDFDYAAANVSELDHFVIERKIAETEGSGSKFPEEEIVTDTGSKGNTGTTPPPSSDNGGK